MLVKALGPTGVTCHLDGTKSPVSDLGTEGTRSSGSVVEVNENAVGTAEVFAMESAPGMGYTGRGKGKGTHGAVNATGVGTDSASSVISSGV